MMCSMVTPENVPKRGLEVTTRASEVKVGGWRHELCDAADELHGEGEEVCHDGRSLIWTAAKA